MGLYSKNIIKVLKLFGFPTFGRINLCSSLLFLSKNSCSLSWPPDANNDRSIEINLALFELKGELGYQFIFLKYEIYIWSLLINVPASNSQSVCLTILMAQFIFLLFKFLIFVQFYSYLNAIRLYYTYTIPILYIQYAKIIL